MEYRKKIQIAGVERTIIICYTLFAILILIMAPMFCDDLWVYMVVLLSLGIAWWAHIKRYRDYRYRALLTSGMMLICFSMHGIYASGFLVIAPTFAALIILLAVYGIPEVVYQEIGFSIFFLVYHAFYLKTMNFNSAAEIARTILAVVAIFVIQWVSNYLIRLRIDTEAELREKITDLEKAEQSKNDFMAN